MATYEALREKYRKRQRDTIIDTLSVGLSCADEMMVDIGLLDGVSHSVELLDGVFDALPFVVILATEGTKVVLGKKSGAAATKHAAFRAAKTGAAMAVGAGVTMAAGGLAAMPAAIVVHRLFERHKSKVLLGRRMQGRIDAVRFLGQKWQPEPLTPPSNAPCVKTLADA